MIAPTAPVASLMTATRNAGVTDGELLGRFVTERDGSAFAALVARHGTMVFGVCRRVVRDWHLAEDAFQATFLILARRAATVSPPGAVAGWLHGVAYRVAKNARRSASRRTGRECPPGNVPEPATPDAADADLRDVIDGEVQKLPGKYRVLIVACDLEGRGRRSVARGLDIPEGTLSSRLTAARKMLAGRLARRGIAPLSVSLVALGEARLVACEAVPRKVLASATQLGCGAPGTVPAGVVSLASKASRTVTHRALLPAALFFLTACGTLCATLSVVDTPPPLRSPGGPTVETARRTGSKADPKLAPKGPNKLLFSRDRQLALIDPDGKNEKALPTGDGYHQPFEAWLSPDGAALAVIGIAMDTETKEVTFPLYVRETGNADSVINLGNLGVGCQAATWSADGTQLACTVRESFRDERLAFRKFLITVKTKERTVLKLPGNHTISDWSRDGKYFLTTSWGSEPETARLHLMNRDGTEHKVLTDESLFAVRGKFSPDGKRVLFATTPSRQKDQKKRLQSLAVLDIATGKSRTVVDLPLNGEIPTFCWSPNGKQIAYLWREMPEEKPEEANEKENATTVVVCDTDGKNPKPVASAKAKGTRLTISGLDWR